MMIGNTHSIYFALPVSVAFVIFTGSVVQAAQPIELHPYLVEVFTTADVPVITGWAVINRLQGYQEINLQNYERSEEHTSELQSH